MQTTIQSTANQPYNGIARLTKRFVFNPGIAITYHNDSRSNRTGLFISIKPMYDFIPQRLQVRVYDYAVLSSLPNRANLTNEM